MAPADYFLSFRHFFGYLAPGTLWLSGILLSFGYKLGTLPEWLEIGAFLIGSYLIGFTVHNALFGLIIKFDDSRQQKRARKEKPQPTFAPNAKLRDAAKALLAKQTREHRQHQAVRDYLDHSDSELEEFCKRYVLEHSQCFRNELNDYEGTINFIVGMIPALLVLAFGTAAHFIAGCMITDRIGTDCDSRLVQSACIVVVSVGLSIWLLFWRLPKKRIAERSVWLKSFIILLLGSHAR